MVDGISNQLTFNLNLKTLMSFKQCYLDLNILKGVVRVKVFSVLKSLKNFDESLSVSA
jgi:hypothetical protein